MLKIRLQRTGRKNIPTFRIVLTDSKNSTKSGKYLEILGNHDSRGEDRTSVSTERVKHWMAQGAKLSDTLHNLFVSKKIIDGKKVNVLPKKTPIKKEVVDAPVAAAPAPVAAPVEAPAEVSAPAEAPVEAPAPEPAPAVEEAPAPAQVEAPVEAAPATEEKPAA